MVLETSLDQSWRYFYKEIFGKIYELEIFNGKYRWTWTEFSIISFPPKKNSDSSRKSGYLWSGNGKLYVQNTESFRLETSVFFIAKSTFSVGGRLLLCAELCNEKNVSINKALTENWWPALLWSSWPPSETGYRGDRPLIWSSRVIFIFQCK